MFLSSFFLVTATLNIVLLFLVTCHVLYSRWITASSKIQRPPGPKPLPFIGNVHQLPQEYQHKVFAQWKSDYGDLIFARFFRTPALIINSLRVAQDLMEKKSAYYSDRPSFISLVDLIGYDSSIVFFPYGERFRRHRRWIHDALEGKDKLQTIRALQRREAYNLLSGLMQTPHAFRTHLQRYVAALIMEIAYGHTVTSMDDKYIELADRATNETNEAGSAGSMLVDFFPVLKHIPTWMPGAGFKRDAARVRKSVNKMLDTPFDMVKDAIMSGTARPSLVATLLEETSAHGGPTPQDETEIKGATGSLYGAGTETTSTVLLTFILAMVLHPEVLWKAQQELDRVVGNERLPDFDDRESLPYLECIINETYRWNSPVPLGVPHKLMVNDEYRGCNIPGGSMVIPNIWAMTQDTNIYPEPDRFCPERFEAMDPHTAEQADPRNMIFGFGRRVCPGRRFADASVWLAVASMLATLDICKARDTAGRAITPSGVFNPGFASHPAHFVCDIRPRSQKAFDIVAQMSAGAVV
ncbi:cytochrome P450 [Amylocystis lapponica]|nr:cytochrome P450 [Amylocystis lapponica]